MNSGIGFNHNHFMHFSIYYYMLSTFDDRSVMFSCDTYSLLGFGCCKGGILVLQVFPHRSTPSFVPFNNCTPICRTWRTRGIASWFQSTNQNRRWLPIVVLRNEHVVEAWPKQRTSIGTPYTRSSPMCVWSRNSDCWLRTIPVIQYCTLLYIYFGLHFHSRRSFPIDCENDSKKYHFSHFLGAAGAVGLYHCARYLRVSADCEHVHDCVHPLATVPFFPSSFPSSINCWIANHLRPTFHLPHKTTRRPWEIVEKIE